MANTSSKVIDNDLYIQLQNEVADLLSDKPRDVVAENLFSLLGDEEVMMLSKRLGMIIMIVEGYSTYAISAKLAVSDSTVRNILSKYKEGRFDSFIPYIKKESFNPSSMWEKKTRADANKARAKRKSTKPPVPKPAVLAKKAAAQAETVSTPQPETSAENKPKKRWGLW
ncbi:hypothetical protein CL653_00815 [bacterium]|nr:hypothetical protein [bacterium]